MKAQKIKTFQKERIINATSGQIWDVISDVGGYHKYTASSISHTQIISGEKEGMIRECTNPKGDSWKEVCTEWVPENRYSFNVDTKAEDFKLPFRHFSGLWEVIEMGDGYSKIRITFKYELKYKWIMWLFKRSMMKKGVRDANELLDNWEKEILKRKSNVVENE